MTSDSKAKGKTMRVRQQRSIVTHPAGETQLACEQFTGTSAGMATKSRASVSCLQAWPELKNRSLWELCEDRLEQKGKLEWPLPEHVYTEISPEQYLEIKGRDGVDWYRNKR
jgi:hypothetical protein